jgi:hypothetical protein
LSPRTPMQIRHRMLERVSKMGPCRVSACVIARFGLCVSANLPNYSLHRKPTLVRSNQPTFLELSFTSIVQAALRQLAWNGIPGELRSVAWPLLLVRHLSGCLLFFSSLKVDRAGLCSNTNTSSCACSRAKTCRVCESCRAYICARSRGSRPTNLAPDRD